VIRASCKWNWEKDMKGEGKASLQSQGRSGTRVEIAVGVAILRASRRALPWGELSRRGPKNLLRKTGRGCSGLKKERKLGRFQKNPATKANQGCGVARPASLPKARKLVAGGKARQQDADHTVRGITCW